MLFAGGFFILFAMNTDRKKELIACFGLLFVTLCWGISFVFVKTTVEVMPPLYLLGIRFLAGGIMIAVIFWKRFTLAGRKLIIHGSYIGILLFIAEVFQTYGCKYTTAGKNKHDDVVDALANFALFVSRNYVMPTVEAIRNPFKNYAGRIY